MIDVGPDTYACVGHCCGSGGVGVGAGVGVGVLTDGTIEGVTGGAGVAVDVAAPSIIVRSLVKSL